MDGKTIYLLYPNEPSVLTSSLGSSISEKPTLTLTVTPQCGASNKIAKAGAAMAKALSGEVLKRICHIVL